MCGGNQFCPLLTGFCSLPLCSRDAQRKRLAQQVALEQSYGLSVARASLLSNTAIATHDTEVALKIVAGGVRYRAQSSRQQIPAVTSVAEQLSECLDTQILGVVWRHNLAKYLSKYV